MIAIVSTASRGGPGTLGSNICRFRIVTRRIGSLGSSSGHIRQVGTKPIGRQRHDPEPDCRGAGCPLNSDNVPIGPELQQQGVTSNQQLSLMRAQTVAKFLVSQGVNPNLVSAQGLGDADPVAPNDTPQGRAQNRRVELTLAGSGT